MKPSFIWGAHCEFDIPAYPKAVLSVPTLAEGTSFSEKDLLERGPSKSDGRATLDEHLRAVEDKGIPRTAPLLVLGVRNNLVNLRAPIILGGRPFSVDGEIPEMSRRPYYGLGCRNGVLFTGQALGDTTETWPEFFVAGIPVLWDDLDEEALLDLILVEAADHSHVFDIPRGNHPDATDESRDVWVTLHNTFKAVVHADLSSALSAMRSVLTRIEPPLRRCQNYLNAVLGTRPDGGLVCIYAHGRLEALGRRAKALGCTRAVCVENSGSVMPTYLPGGIAGRQIPLLRAPNHRSQGRALLVLELEGSVFQSAPLSGAVQQ